MNRTWQYRTLALTILLASAASWLSAEDNANRTLLGNQAVRKDLQLTDEQAKKIDALLSEMEKEIAASEDAAKKNGNDADTSEATGAIVQKFGVQAQELLEQKQQIRLWEIGAQQAGSTIFANQRAKRLLRLTPEQLQQMAALYKKTSAHMVEVAKDVEKDIRTVQEEVEQAKKQLFDDCVAVLTEEQRKDFTKLLGKPFDRELLTNSAGAKPRALTFIFGTTWQNSHYLLTDPAIVKEMGATPNQLEKVRKLLEQEDKLLTDVRLGALKSLKHDFAELSDEHKQRVVRSILDKSGDVFRRTNELVTAQLTPQQLEVLDRRLVQLIGARALGSDKIADRLKLTPEQKQAFAKAMRQFEEKSAGLRVVRKRSDFDTRAFDEHQAQLDKAARAILTPEQAEQLDNLGKEDR